MQRVKIQRRASWTGPCAGYATNYAVANHWRVASHMEVADLIGEFHLAFMECRERYPNCNDRHFMSLFKKACFSYLMNAAARTARYRRESAFAEYEDCTLEPESKEHACHSHAAAEPERVLSDAPGGISLLFRVGARDWHRLRYSVSRGRADETPAQKARRLAARVGVELSDEDIRYVEAKCIAW